MEKRIYGKWGGNPQGVKEDETRCIESIRSDYVNHQCSRPRGHGKDGLYCKQHDPESVAKKSKALEDKNKARWEEFSKKHDKQSRINAAHEPMLNALRECIGIISNECSLTEIACIGLDKAKAAILLAEGNASNRQND